MKFHQLAACLLSVLFALQVNSFAQKQNIEIVFEGNSKFTQAELKEGFEKYSFIPLNKEIPERLFNLSIPFFKRKFFRAKGYIEANVVLLYKSVDEEKTMFVFWVEEGEKFIFDNVQISGSKVFSNKDLLADFPLQKGDILNTDIVYEWLRVIKFKFADKGYVNAKIDFEDKLFDKNKETGLASFYINIDEGEIYKFGKVEFVGKSIIEQSTLKKALIFREGDIFSRNKLNESIEKINKLNLVKWISPGLNVEETIDEVNQKVDIKVEIIEKD